jgi:hypothetical protein
MPTEPSKEAAFAPEIVYDLAGCPSEQPFANLPSVHLSFLRIDSLLVAYLESVECLGAEGAWLERMRLGDWAIGGIRIGKANYAGLKCRRCKVGGW